MKNHTTQAADIPAEFNRVAIRRQAIFADKIVLTESTISLRPEAYAELLRYADGNKRLLHAELRQTAVALPPDEPFTEDTPAERRAKRQDFSFKVRDLTTRRLRSAYRPGAGVKSDVQL